MTGHNWSTWPASKQINDTEGPSISGSAHIAGEGGPASTGPRSDVTHG